MANCYALFYDFFSAVVCTIMSSAVLRYCHSWPTLIEGDRVYLNALESQNILDTETLLHPLIVYFKLPIKLQENYPLIEESCDNLYQQFMTDISNYLYIT